MPLDWSPLWFSLRNAGLAALIALAVAWPLAWMFVSRQFPGRELLDAAVNLPLLLPPAVLVYYLLAQTERWAMAFDWRTAVILSAIYTLPLPLQLSRAGIAAVNPSLINAARSLGAGEWRVLRVVTAPLAWRALVAAVLAAFVRAFVDFAATAVVANTGTGWVAAVASASALGALYAVNRLWQGRAWA